MDDNVLPKLKTPEIFYPIIGMIIILIIILFFVLIKFNPDNEQVKSKSTQETVGNIFIVLFFTLIILGVCIALLPNLKDIKVLFEQIHSVTYVILYTIFLILFFGLTSKDTINKYAKGVLLTTIPLGFFAFYKGTTPDYAGEFNINYERIKTMILLFCLITSCIIYYNNDPGDYITKYFGYSFLLTIIITIFAFLYLLIILTLPDKVNDKTKATIPKNFLENFTKFSSYGSLGFLLFIIIITITISTYPSGFFNNKELSATAMILILLICILWSILLVAIIFPEVSNNGIVTDKLNLFKRSLLVLFGIVISSLIIYWIVYNVQHYSGQSGTVSFILNMLIVIIVLSLIYKTINVKLPAGNSNKNAFFEMIINTIFYIPCLFSDVFDYFTQKSGKSDSSVLTSILVLVITIVLFLIYFKMPSIYNIINLQGGEQLVNKPVYTDTEYSLGTYQELNGSENFDYQYAISFWVFIDSAPPNTNPSYTKYTSLLNFGGKPNVLYNGQSNTLMVTMQQKDLKKVSNNKLFDFDENGNRIIYINNNMLLQKWNNIIINYSGGVLDIFLNGELVKSDIGIVPYYTIDNLTIGENDGIKGGICNVVYFKRALNSANIYYLYNMVKDKQLPVLNYNNETIIKKNINKVGSSVNEIV
jgi:hypothetical protein